MKSTSKRIRDIENANTLNFVKLTKISGLNPKTDFRYKDLSYIDCSNCDLNGFDFTGSILKGTNFENSLISGAVFDSGDLLAIINTKMDSKENNVQKINLQENGVAVFDKDQTLVSYNENFTKIWNLKHSFLRTKPKYIDIFDIMKMQYDVINPELETKWEQDFIWHSIDFTWEEVHYLTKDKTILVISKGNTNEGFKITSTDVTLEYNSYAEFIIACQIDDTNKIIELIKSGINVNCKNKNGDFPILVACSAGNIKLAELLLINGADVNQAGKDGLTALKITAIKGGLKLVKLLVKHGAKVNYLPSLSKTGPLEDAVEHQQQEVVEYLTSVGANTENLLHEMPELNLFSACWMGLSNVANEQLDKNLNLDIHVNCEGDTFLTTACLCGHINIVELLIRYNADVNFKNSDGNSPLEIANNYEHHDIVELLKRHGAK